jgi:hypothetical protein
MTALALLLIGTGLTLGFAREALADYTWNSYPNCCGSDLPRDKDGYVREYTGDPTNGHYDRVLGQTFWIYYSGTSGGYDDYIEYDWAEMRRCNATSSDNQKLIAHERAHSRGWGHYESPEGYNAAYDPIIRTVHCPS